MDFEGSESEEEEEDRRYFESEEQEEEEVDDQVDAFFLDLSTYERLGMISSSSARNPKKKRSSLAVKQEPDHVVQSHDMVLRKTKLSNMLIKQYNP